jgi:hypothetical protein
LARGIKRFDAPAIRRLANLQLLSVASARRIESGSLSFEMVRALADVSGRAGEQHNWPL